jgi:FKBP-type peptidyl-prolyl cis-trans isomerase 2
MLSNGLPARVTTVGEAEITLDLNHEVSQRVRVRVKVRLRSRWTSTMR